MKNNLKLFRKKTQLTQSDVAFLLGMPDSTLISKYEQGERHPSVDTLIAYTLLTNSGIHELLKERTRNIRNQLIRSIDLRIPMLAEDEQYRSEERKQALIQLQTQLSKTTL